MPSRHARQAHRRTHHDDRPRGRPQGRGLFVPVTAYYRAKARDMAPGRMLDDWREETPAADAADDGDR